MSRPELLTAVLQVVQREIGRCLLASTGTAHRPMTLHRLRALHAAGEKIVMITRYDSTFARAVDDAGVDTILVGDSPGVVMQGRSGTVGVSPQDIAYRTRCVAQGNRHAWVIGELPFGSDQASPQQALASATALMQAGARVIKLEGGGWTTETVGFLTQRGVPVCAHRGLTPQSGWMHHRDARTMAKPVLGFPL